jgi:hypothetical protein
VAIPTVNPPRWLGSSVWKAAREPLDVVGLEVGG